MTEKETYYELPQAKVLELDKKMRELLELCQINHVPFFAACAIANSEEETKYLNIVYSAQSHSMKLTDDRIRKHMLVANGEFDVVPKREVSDFTPYGIAEGTKE